MYIMKSIGERTDPCRNPFWRKFGDDISSPILYISLWNWYVLWMACRSPGDTPNSCSLSHSLSLLTLLYALDRSTVAVYKGKCEFASLIRLMGLLMDPLPFCDPN